MKKLKKSVLFYTILYAILLYTLYLILEKFNLMFRQWVNIISFIIIGSGCIIGIGQVIFSINKKWLKIVLGIIFVISLVIIDPFVYIFSILAYKPEHVVYKNDEKYVAYVIAFHMTEVKYYEYKNIFVSGSKVKIIEYYGKGGFDPLDSKNGYVHNVESVDYYE